MTVPTFPVLPGQAWPVTRSTMWSTSKEMGYNGASVAFANWSFPIYQFTLSFNYLGSGNVNGQTNTDWQTLAGFYDSVKGAANIFQYAFTDDSTVTSQNFGTGDGATTQFQLSRTLGTATSPVYAVSGTPVIKNNGVTQTVTTDYTINAYGLVSFSVAPVTGHALTWTGSYNWYCRFDDDSLDFSLMMTRIWSCPKVTFTTVKFGLGV